MPNKIFIPSEYISLKIILINKNSLYLTVIAQKIN